MKFRFLLFSAIIVTSTLFSADGSTISLLDDIHDNGDLIGAAQCLLKNPYEFVISYQMSLILCSQEPNTYLSTSDSERLQLEKCVASKVKIAESIDDDNWEKCYQNGPLGNIIRNIFQEEQRAEKAGAAMQGQILTPEKACRIRTDSGEYFEVSDGGIYLPAGTELALTGAGGDGFSVLVGISANDISGDLSIEYESINCSQDFIQAISNYGYEENSPYMQVFYAAQRSAGF